METELLQQILAAQKEQTALLRQHLGRFKFSIRGLLMLMTLLCVGLGVVAYRMPEGGGRIVWPAPASPTVTYQDPSITFPPPGAVVPTINQHGTPNTAATYEVVPSSRPVGN
jgi:hypothetical protein